MVNWIVCRDDNGQNGWQDVPEFHESVSSLFDKVNLEYSTSLPKGYSLTCEPEYTHVEDTRIRFELNEVIFIDKTEFNLGCSATDILDYVFAWINRSKLTPLNRNRKTSFPICHSGGY